MELGLDGKRALVTGAGAGIGRGIALCLAHAGCDVAVADIDAKRAADAAAEVAACGRVAMAITADVRRDDEVIAMVAAACRQLGGLDVAINNVGMMAGHHAKPFVEMAPESIRDIVEQNLLATALCCRAEAQAMMAAHGGAIINVSSGESLRPSLHLAPYGAAKAAINHLTRTLALELGPHGIRVNGMAPGTTLTESVRAALSDDAVESLRRSTPLGRLTEPDDLGRVAVFLASDLARHVTGQLILADGGADLAMRRPGFMKEESQKAKVKRQKAKVPRRQAPS